MTFERRKHLRMPVVWKATVRRISGEQLPGSTDNVSRDGLNVILPKALLLGEPVTIDVITQCLGQTCYFRLDGVIVYAEALADNLGVAVGLRLLQPDGRYEALIGALEQGPSGAPRRA